MLDSATLGSMTLIDIVKIGGPAILSFWLGRFQAMHSNKAIRKKEACQKLIELVRKLAKDAIEYHSGRIDAYERQKSSALIKNLLFQARTDIKAFAPFCKTDKQIWMDKYIRIQDSITGYPFEPQEMAEEVDQTREQQISEACEGLVRTINQS